jgi:hypothetical protein
MYVCERTLVFKLFCVNICVLYIHAYLCVNIRVLYIHAYLHTCISDSSIRMSSHQFVAAGYMNIHAYIKSDMVGVYSHTHIFDTYQYKKIVVADGLPPCSSCRLSHHLTAWRWSTQAHIQVCMCAGMCLHECMCVYIYISYK